MSHYSFCRVCVLMDVQPTGFFQPNERFAKPQLCKKCDPECVRVKKVTFADKITCHWPSIRSEEEELRQMFKALCLSD
jgi:hypothetical protein